MPASTMQVVQRRVAALRGQNACRLPDPSPMLLAAADEIEGQAANPTIPPQFPASKVCCQVSEIITKRFVFGQGPARGPMTEFARLFQPGGIVDRFFTSKLDPMVTLAGEFEWNRKPGSAGNCRWRRSSSSAMPRKFAMILRGGGSGAEPLAHRDA